MKQDSTKIYLKILGAIFVILAILLFISLREKPQTTGVEKEVGFIAPPEIPEKPAVPVISEPQPKTFTEPVTALGDTHPQLKIISFNSQPVTPVQGYMANFIVNVKNVGDDAPETDVEFYVNDLLFKTAKLQPLTRNAAGVVKVEWPAAEKGDYVIKVKVIPLPGEKFVDDNVDKISFTIY